MTPHPRLPQRIAVGVRVELPRAVDIYQFDAELGQLKKRHHPGPLARTVAYASGDPRNLLIGLEGGIPFAR